MNNENADLLKEISHKLDQLVVLWKLGNRETIEKFKKEIKKDKVHSKILEYADGSLSYSDLSKKVANETGFAEITVKQKLSTLKDMGVLISKRKGRESYYENSGLFD
jgi:DNA-binding transcriptional ArsR family regulator